MATFDWAHFTAQLERLQSVAEADSTPGTRYKRWLLQISWAATDDALANRFPELHRLLSLGHFLLQRLQRESSLHWEQQASVAETLLLVLDIVFPPPECSMGDGSALGWQGLQAELRIKSISALVAEIASFYKLANATQSPETVADAPPLKRWYEDAMKQFPWLTWPPSHRVIQPGPRRNVQQIAPPVLTSLPGCQDAFEDMFMRAQEWALAAVSPAHTYRDLTEELVVGRNPCGRGASCNVYRASWNSETGEMKVAVKMFRIACQAHSDYATKLSKRMKDEMDIWALLEHPHILPFYGMHWIGGVPGLVSPWCKNGDISKYLVDICGPAKLAISLELMEQVALGLEYLHTHSPVIVHGDLKGANILISDDGRALLCDFGLAAIEAAAAETSVVLLSATSAAKGTYRWMAHELVVYDDAPPTKESDVWAFGCVLLEILGGRVPFHEKTDVLQVILAISQGEIPSRPPHTHDCLWNLMLQCWRLVPSDRPCAGCILAEIRAVLASDELECLMAG